MNIEAFSRCLGLSDVVLTSVDEVIHASLMMMVHLYLVVVGMPDAVQAYVDTNDLNVVEEKQKEILDLHKWDISQYDPNKKLDINEIFNLIPDVGLLTSQYASGIHLQVLQGEVEQNYGAIYENLVAE